MAGEEVTLVGEGGAATTFVLPLSEVFADQLRSGALRPADDESAAVLAAADSASEPDDRPLVERIDAVTTHAQANALGAELGLAFEAKKPGVDAKKEALHAAAAASGATE